MAVSTNWPTGISMRLQFVKPTFETLVQVLVRNALLPVQIHPPHSVSIYYPILRKETNLVYWTQNQNY